MTASLATTRPPLAVVGLDGLFPGSTDIGGFWRDVLAGNDQLREIPETHWLIDDYFDADPKAEDKTYARRGAFLDEVVLDPLAWGLPPSTLPSTDTSQLLALIVAQRVLADATAGQFAALDRSKVSVILGVTGGQELLGQMVARLQQPVWIKALRESGLGEDEVQGAVRRILDHYVPWQESTFPGLLGNVVAGRIANRLDLGGTNCITDAACASSLSALSMAANELYLGDSDLVITGGVDAMNDVFMFMCFSKTPALSPSGDCRPFSAEADGTMLGEGVGMLALKRLEDAERDGDRVYAVVTGIGSSSDGRSKSVYAPVHSGQAKAIRRAYAHAGYGPETVELIEAHGTGTKAGDAAEFEGLRTVFAESGRSERPWCSIGSVKSLIGHTKAAAGAAGLIKAVLALQERTMPAMPKVDAPNPKLGFDDSAFYINTRPRPWVRGPEHERRAGVSSFGFGGSNFHVTLAEYRGPAPLAERHRATDAELVVVCGDVATVVRQARAQALSCTEPGALAWLSSNAAASYDPAAPVRVGIVARDEVDLCAKLTAVADHLDSGTDATLRAKGVSLGRGPRDGEIAFLFPGQGSQYLQMGADLAIAFEPALSAWDLAASLDSLSELDEVVFPPTAFTDAAREEQSERLTSTDWAQPAIGAASLALLRLLTALGVRPASVGGHSYGEVMALHAAGRIDADSAMRLSRRRGELMRDASRKPGAMLAVGRSLTEISERIGRWGADVVIANHNGPEQIVLSGPTTAIESVAAQLDAEGIGSQRLVVGTAFHSPIVADAAEHLASFLDGIEIGPSTCPVYGNTTAAPYEADAAAVRAQLAAQLTQPVRFVEMIERMYADGARTFIEVGPGRVLSGLVGKILDERSHRAVALDRRGSTGVMPLLGGLAELVAAGAPLDLTSLWAGFRTPDDPATRVAPKLAIPINGANLGRPYPPADGSASLPAPNPPRSLAPAPVAQPHAAPTPVAPTLVSQPAVAAPAPAPAVAPVPIARGDAGAVASVHEQAGEVHTACIEAITQLHASYLANYQATLAQLADAPANGNGHHANGHVIPKPAIVPVVERPAPVVAAVVTAVPAPVAPVAAPITPAPSPATAPASGPALDLTDVLLDVIADKTGYPAEMLGLEMELEGDLGIDSIKRVEILAGMRDRVGTLPEIEVTELAELVTLQEIADYMTAHANGGAAAPAPTPQPVAASTTGQPITRLTLAVTPTPAPGLAMPGLYGGTVTVIDGGSGIAARLTEALIDRGVAAECAPDVPSSASALVLCHGLGAVPDDGYAASLQAFGAARTLSAASDGPRLLVTVQDTGGRFGLGGVDGDRGWLGGFAALARTAAREWPAASVKAIDVARGTRDPQLVADAIAAELTEGGPALEVGLAADGGRITLGTSAVSVPPGSARLGPSDVVVVSGGARGVTAACVQALAGSTGARFVLLGRTPLPVDEAYPGLEGAALKGALFTEAERNGSPITPSELGARAAAISAAREIRTTLAAIAAAGGEARYVPVDVSDADAVAVALTAVRSEWGPITAVVHGAGVLADRLIADKTDEQFQRVYGTKIDGLRALLAATAADPVTVLCAFSSVAARTGNSGQVDYAMANEVLNKVLAAEQTRRGEACLVKSIGWGPWAGFMVTPELRAHFAAAGVALLPVDAGAQAFVDELSAPAGPDVEVVIGAGTDADSLLAGGPGASTAADVLVTAARYPELSGHAIKGTVIVPVAYAVEWMARAAEAFWPGRPVHGLSEVRVLRGIKLAGFVDGAAAVLAVRRGSGDGELEIAAPDGILSYRATALFDARPAAIPPALELGDGGEPVPYGGRGLFHGPSFHVVDRVEGIGDGGIHGTVHGVRSMGWGAADWRTDPAALDAVLQLSLVWIDRVLDSPALPTRLGAVRWHAAPADGPLECTVAVTSANDVRAQGNATVCDQQGRILFEVTDLEAHVLPSAKTV